LFKRIALILFDLFFLFLALRISLQLRYGAFGISYDFIDHVWLFSPVFLLWIVVFYINQLYDYYSFSDSVGLIYNHLRSVVANFILTIIIFYVIPSLTLAPKTILLLTIIISSGLLLIFRIIFNHIFSLDDLRRKILIIGNNKIEISLAKAIRRNRSFGWRVVGFVTTDPGHRVKGFKKIGNLRQLDHILHHQKIDAVTLDINRLAGQDEVMQVIADHCTARHIEIVDVYTLYERLTGQVPLVNLPQLWFSNVNQSSRRFTSIIKRIGDISVGLIGLLIFILFSPLLYILVKLDSPGPFFFIQTRVGEGSQIFRLYKIRTFRHQIKPEKKASWTRDQDSRITMIGRWLRRTRLDELPQFYNILLGQMSLVGPRPEQPEFITKLNQRQKLYYKRHLIKPGLTGWAQINMGYGGSYQDADKKLQYDLYYLKHRSLFLDMLIILQTARIILLGKGK